jgi:hypothetical protein
MPKVFEWNGYRFFFYSNEGNPKEPCHIHVRRGDQVAKFWVYPVVGVASSWGMNPVELARLSQVVVERADEIRRKWHEYFGA